ncbi:leucine-rich repeat domain-containing protein [Aquimarina addita]|uniref:Leucine-rich repeat domain-containing protein n=1 Tax=Aquimarina addita TaxID=870485 RepID=A0ABP7X6R9_9FLAO
MKKLILVCALLFNSLLFAQDFTVNDIEYTITFTNTVELSNYKGTSTTVTIPTTVTYDSVTFSVTSIGNEAFLDKNLISVTIPDSITTIGDYAFSNNNKLTNVISESLDPATLADTIFGDHSSINLSIPSNTEETYQTAGWTGFDTILLFNLTFIVDDIQYTITSLTDQTTVEVSDYTGISTTVAIPTTVTYNNISFTVTTIGHAAFAQKGLTSVTIPDTVTTIRDYAFAENDLISIAFPNGVKYIGFDAFWNNDLTSVTIPDSITTIIGGAFADNQLTSVTIPDSVTSIGDYAFFGNNLTSVTSESLNPTTLANNVFDNRSVIDLSIPEGTILTYETAGWTGFNSVTEANTLSTYENTILENLSFTNYANSIVITTTNGIRLENVSLYNISGQRVLASRQSEISINYLASGVYIAQLTTNVGTVIKKFAK